MRADQDWALWLGPPNDSIAIAIALELATECMIDRSHKKQG
ncbi:MAG: hypothetical protein ACI97A_002664 [Planctomycetota bacterium]